MSHVLLVQPIHRDRTHATPCIIHAYMNTQVMIHIVNNTAATLCKPCTHTIVRLIYVMCSTPSSAVMMHSVSQKASSRTQRIKWVTYVDANCIWTDVILTSKHCPNLQSHQSKSQQWRERDGQTCSDKVNFMPCECCMAKLNNGL